MKYAQLDRRLSRLRESAASAGLVCTAGSISGLKKHLSAMKAEPEIPRHGTMRNDLKMTGGVLDMEKAALEAMIETVPQECRACPKCPVVAVSGGREGMRLLMVDGDVIWRKKEAIAAGAMLAGGCASVIGAAVGMAADSIPWGVAAGIAGLCAGWRAVRILMRHAGVFSFHSVAGFEKLLQRSHAEINRCLSHMSAELERKR